MNPRRSRVVLFAGIALTGGAPFASATPRVQGGLDAPDVALDVFSYSTSLVGTSAIEKIVSGDFDADGNVDLVCRKADDSFFVAYMAGVLEDVVRAGGTGVLDVAVLPAPAGEADRILAADATGLTVWSSGSGLFPAASSAAFEIQVDDPLLVAVSAPDSGGTAYGWIVGDGGTEVTPFEWDVATGDATELTTFTLSSAAAQIVCFSAYGGAAVDLGVLTAAGASIVDVEGDVLAAVSGQDDDSIIARIPGSSSSADALACVLRQTGSSQRRLYVASVAGCDPFVGLGTYDYGACAVADVNDDGALDLVVSRTDEKDLVALLNDGTLDHTSARFTNDPSGYAIVAEGPQSATPSLALLADDLDNDADDDVVWPLHYALASYVDVYVLRNLAVCAPSLSLEVSEFTEITCYDPESGYEDEVFVAELEFLHSAAVPSWANSIRVLRLPPSTAGAEIVGAGIEAEYFALGSGSTQTLSLVFEDVSGASKDEAYFGAQYVDRDGVVVSRATPMRIFLVGRKIAGVRSVVTSAVWPSPAPLCVSVSVLGSVTHADCDDGVGDEDGGDTGEVPKPPPVQPPYGGGGGG